MNDPQPPHSQETREAIFDQLAHLIREADALEPLLERVPGDVFSERPPDDDWTIKETFALLARWDEAVYTRWIERTAGEDEPRLESPNEEALLDTDDGDDDWNERAITDLLARVQEARRALIDALEALPPRLWTRSARFSEDGGDEGERRDVYALTRNIARRDHARLRRMTRRLHESNLSTKGHDVPR